MIWNSMPSDSLITEDVQVHSLRLAVSYIRSRDTTAIEALTAITCPGNTYTKDRHSNYVSFFNFLYTVH